MGKVASIAHHSESTTGVLLAVGDMRRVHTAVVKTDRSISKPVACGHL